jgi:glutaminyl-tRNA synthetase
VRLYNPLLLDAHLAPEEDFLARINPHSLEVVHNCRFEASLSEAQPGDRYQFERQGYFFVDPIDSKPGKPVFNRIVTLKDSWVKKQPKS